MTEAKKRLQRTDSMGEWMIRLLKGILVGIGAIVPGLSGGALAVVFGLYEPLIKFIANLREKFIQNVLFFLPVGIGGVLGVVAFSTVVDFAFTYYAAEFTWLFIGFISGTFPSLYRTSGEKGRKTQHWLILIFVAAGTLLLMRWLETVSSVILPTTFWNWILSGVLFGLGAVVPGMSPSNFLIYLGLYQPMASGIRHLDLSVIIPLALGVIFCVFAFAKLVAWLFKKYFASMYHFILGIVIGSTLAIIPKGVSGWTIVICALLFLIGAASSFGLVKLDEKYGREPLI